MLSMAILNLKIIFLIYVRKKCSGFFVQMPYLNVIYANTLNGKNKLVSYKKHTSE